MFIDLKKIPLKVKTKIKSQKKFFYYIIYYILCGGFLKIIIQDITRKKISKIYFKMKKISDQIF